MQFALVRLVRADSSPLPPDSPPQGITNGDGRYRFDGVAPGRYRVQLLRIGFRPTLSDPVQVAAGETVQIELRAATAADTAARHRHSGRLRDRKGPQRTPTAPDALATSARWSVGAHRAHGAIRYHVLLHEESYELKADGPTAPGTLDQPYVSDPKWAVKNAARNREQRLSRGYYGPSNKFGDGF